MRVVVPTCDRYLWALRPFQYLFNTYWSELQPVVIGGFSFPPFQLRGNFQFVQIDRNEYPAERWSDGLIRLLTKFVEDDIIVLLLEDYWLCRGVNHEAVRALAEFMRGRDDILRIDLTADRLHSGKGVDVGYYGCWDLLETSPDTPYQWSTQACLVNRRHFLSCLKPGLAPWDFELQGNELIPEGLRVLGTRQWPVRYVNAIGMGCEWRYRTEHVRDGVGGRTIERIPQEHVNAMLEAGILPPNERLPQNEEGDPDGE